MRTVRAEDQRPPTTEQRAKQLTVTLADVLAAAKRLKESK
jgi:hypothetical protein